MALAAVASRSASMVSISTFVSALRVGPAAGYRRSAVRLTNVTTSIAAATPAVKMALLGIHAAVLQDGDLGAKTNHAKMLYGLVTVLGK